MGSTYRAIAYATELPNGSAAGEIFFSPGQLHFSSEIATRSVGLDDLKIRLDGAGGTEAFFNHPRLPGWELLLVDGQGLSDPELLEMPHLRDFLKTAIHKQRKMSPGLKFLLWLPVILLLLLWLCFLALKPLAAAAAKKIPIQTEVDFGRQSWKMAGFSRMEAKNVSPALKAKLDKAVARLLPQVSHTGYPFEFTILDDPTPNAFAVPGGQIGVHTGLLELAETPEHVAGVIAHELAHVTERHSLRQLLQTAGLQVVFAILLGDTSLSGLTSIASQLKSQAYSRDAEREADATGWKYLIAAEIDPKPMIEFFEALKRKTEAQAGVPTILSTHPATQERIDTLTGWLNTLPADFKPVPLE